MQAPNRQNAHRLVRNCDVRNRVTELQGKVSKSARRRAHMQHMPNPKGASPMIF